MKRLIRMLPVLLAVICLCSCAAKKRVCERVLYYPSVDQRGDSLTLSGKVCVPIDKPAKGIILIPHYTISAQNEAPSVKMTAESKPVKEDYVLLMPDYLGYGISSDRAHPYLHGELTARNCVDMLLGAMPLLDSLKLGVPLDSIYIVGFSQGGASAVWTLKLLEEQYADRFHVIKCIAGGGPYDVAATHDDAVARNYISMPAIIPILVMGTDAAYDLHLNPADFFTPIMEEKYTKFVANKEYGVASLFFHMLESHKLDYWLTPLAMDHSQPEMRRFYDGLLQSSLVHYAQDEKDTADNKCPSWIPKSPLYIFHSTKDDVVTFHCAEHLKRCYPDLPNITYDFGNYGNHLKSSRVFFKRLRSWLTAP